MTLRRYRMVPSTPTSLEKLARRLSSVTTTWFSSTPTRDHVPQDTYANRESHAGTATTAEAVSWLPTAVTGVGPARPVASSTPWRSSPTVSPGLRSGGNRRGSISSLRMMSTLHCRSWTLRSCEVGGTAGSDDLEYRVQRQKLDAGHGVQLRGRHCGKHLGHHTVGTRVAVVYRVAEQSAVFVEQAVVNGPRVHPDGIQAPVRRGESGRAQAVEHTPIQAQDVPVQCAADRHGHVVEAGDLVQAQRVWRDLGEHHPATGRTEVDGREGSHRRNAAATPASTGMCRPVVCERSPAVSANTAAATCSGSTSRLRSVRLA